MSLVMENLEFSQQLNDMDTNTTDLSFEARKRRRSSRGRRPEQKYHGVWIGGGDGRVAWRQSQ